MPAFATTITATTSHELKLSPAIRRRLVTQLRTYQELATKRTAIETEMANCRAAIAEIQTELEESSIELEGFKSTLVAPMKSVFDKKTFVRIGGRLDLIEAATSKVPGKIYVRITPPGAVDTSEE